jgi:hypothetical protein
LRRNPQQRGLAGAIVTEQSDEFAGRNAERDATQSAERAISFFNFAEFEAQAAGCEGHGHEARSAANQIAQDFLRARSLASVVFFGDCASLTPQFEFEKCVLQLVEAMRNLAVNVCYNFVRGRTG